MKLHLNQVWSHYEQGAPPVALLAGWRLVSHQQAAFQALNDPRVDVVFDLAMTGDGKTLVANLPLLRPLDGWRQGSGVLIYPTNELIRDQKRQADEYQRLFGVELQTQVLNGEEIIRTARELDAGKPDALRYILRGPKLLLTNPDIFTLIENFAYTARHENPATLAQQFSNRYRYIVFDEFHTFDTSQVNAILDAMLFIRATSGQYPPKYLFPSATPSHLLQERLEAAGFRLRLIEGQYRHGVDPGPEYRRVLQPAVLEIEACEQGEGGIYGWFERNLERVREFYRSYPQSKGAVICNSVLAAKRLYAYLRNVLEPEITVGENTGLTGRNARYESFNKDLMVTTSTVDVGVDFRINFLVFESLDAGTFIQRLGRLGRHAGSETYHAIALLPRFIVERLEQQYPSESALDRPAFFETLRSEVFPEHRSFEEFIPRWGSVKSCLRLFRLKRYPVLRETYRSLAEGVYRLRNIHLARARDLEGTPAVYHELTAFRGAGLMDVWVYDASSESIASMSVLRLLNGASFRLLSETEARERADSLQHPFYPSALGLYAEILGYLDDRVPVQLYYRYALVDGQSPLHQALDRRGFYLEAHVPEMGAINRKLEARPLCTCVAQESPQTLRRRYALPPLFEVYRLRDETYTEYGIAFGQDALLLDSILHWRRSHEVTIV
jgi:CRISPR-associated endonuclease/helicase Cas3